MDDLLHASHLYGRDPAFVIAGGGNTSLKTADRLWVKASGTSLATITAAGFVEMDRAKLQQILESTDWPTDTAAREAEFQRRINDARIHPELNQRASVEVLLHHLLPQRLVVHTHATVVNAITCCVNGRRLAGERLAAFAWQPYVDPGLILAKSLATLVDEYQAKNNRPPAVVLLQNHGLIVGGDGIDEITEATDSLLRLLPPLPVIPTPSRNESMSAWCDLVKNLLPDFTIASDADHPAVRWVTDTPEGRTAASAGPLTPDQIVYARSFPLGVSGTPSTEGLRTAIAKYVGRFGYEPWVILIAGVGLIAVRKTEKLAEITRAVYTDAATACHAAQQLGGVSAMLPRDRHFIENWEVEAYRRSVSG